jgi:hypothetical protein
VPWSTADLVTRLLEGVETTITVGFCIQWYKLLNYSCQKNIYLWWRNWVRNAKCNHVQVGVVTAQWYYANTLRRCNVCKYILTVQWHYVNTFRQNKTASDRTLHILSILSWLVRCARFFYTEAYFPYWIGNSSNIFLQDFITCVKYKFLVFLI